MTEQLNDMKFDTIARKAHDGRAGAVARELTVRGLRSLIDEITTEEIVGRGRELTGVLNVFAELCASEVISPLEFYGACRGTTAAYKTREKLRQADLILKRLRRLSNIKSMKQALAVAGGRLTSGRILYDARGDGYRSVISVESTRRGRRVRYRSGIRRSGFCMTCERECSLYDFMRARYVSIDKE